MRPVRETGETHMSCLFNPCRIGSIELKNRFVRSATCESRADKNGLLRDDVYPIYERLATGGVGLIITGHMYCHPDWKCSPNQTGIWDDRHLPGLEKLAQASKGNGVKAIAQINSAAQKLAELSAADLEEQVACFVNAARRAVKAGFDGVQLHASHGYLLGCFLAPSENQRTDEYGAGAAGRRQLLLDIARETRAAIGAHVPLLCKLGVVDGRENSLPIEEAAETAAALQAAGVDAIEVSCATNGPYAQPALEKIDGPEKEAYFATQARTIKEAVTVPVILVGGLRSLDMMERVVHEGSCDLVSLCRPLIREPALVNALAEGRTHRSACVSCNKCFTPRGFRCIFEPKPTTT